MGSRKVNTEGIDEELLIASIGRRTLGGSVTPTDETQDADGGATPEPAAAPPKEKPSKANIRKKRQDDEDYCGAYLQRNEIRTRQCVYISREVHNKILRIVNNIAGCEISVGGFVDTVLRQHLEQHKETINELYKKQWEDLI